MKKITLSILLVIVTILSTALPAFAAETEPSTIVINDGGTITYFADGSTLTISAVKNVDEPNLVRATTQTVTKSKDVTYKDKSGNLEWKYTLTATFSCESGVSSTCTKASYSTTINDNSWSFSNGSATKSGNVATGNGTFKLIILFITMNTYNINITLTCDKYGNVT